MTNQQTVAVILSAFYCQSNQYDFIETSFVFLEIPEHSC